MSSIYSSDGGSIKTLDYLKTAEIVYNYLNESANFHKYYEAFWDYYLLIYDNAYYFISPEYKHLVKQSAYKFIKEIKNISNSDYLKSNNFKKLENIIY